MSIRFTRIRFVIVFSLLLCVAVLAAVRFVPTTSADNEPAMLPPVTATDTVAVVVGNADGNADPGETLEYTVTVNNGGTDATGVSISSILSPVTTFVGGSVAIGPAAGNDTYPQTVIGNVSINSASIPYNVLTNDFLGQNPAATITAFDATSANGGQVVLNTGTGTFTYNPPPGFEGNDTFNYTLSNATSTSVGTVTIPVSGMVWFINNNAAACTTLAAGCGRLSNPFSSLAAFQALNNNTGSNPGNNDNIFIFESATGYSGGVTLLANQRITGQDATATLSAITGLTPGTGSTAFPAMNTGGSATTLTTGGINVGGGGGNTVRGMTINNTATAKINGTNFGTLTVGNNVSPDVILSGTGKAIDVNNGTFAASSAFVSVATTSSTSHGMQLISVGGTVAFGSTSVSGSASQGIFVSASSVNLNFGNTTVGATTAGEGVRLESNTGGTRTFGTLSIVNSAVQGFTDSGGGNTSVTGLATITNPANVGILVSGKTAGTSVTFANVSNTGSGSHGVHLNNNAGTVTFADLDIAADANQRGILATNNTGTITTTSGTIADTGTATAVEITNASGTVPLNMQLTSVSANGGANGIILSNTSSSGVPGGFSVLGSGGTCTNANTSGCSGGTIQNTTGADNSTVTPLGTGIVLNNVTNVSLTRMFIHDHSNYAIRGNSVVGFTFANSVINGNNGGTTPASAGSPFNDSSVRFTELTGSASITNSHIQGGFSDNFKVVNTTGLLNRITFDAVIIGTNHLGATALDDQGNDGISLETLNSAQINATIQNCTFTASRGDLFQFNSNASSGGTDDLILNNNSLTNNYPRISTGGGGTSIFSNGLKNFSFHIEGNLFRDAVGHNVLMAKTTGTGSYSGTFTNNDIGAAATTNSGSLEGSGMKVQSTGLGSLTIAITNNRIRQYNNFGIELLTGGGASATGGNFNATVTGNTITNPGTNPATAAISKNGVHLNGGTNVGDTFAICADIGGAGALENSIVGSGLDGVPPTGLGNIDFRLRQRQATTVRLPGYAGANNDNAAVIAYVQGRNVGSPTGLVSNTVPTGGGFTGGAACAQPSTFSSPGNEDDKLAFFDSSEFQVPSSSLFGRPSAGFTALPSYLRKSSAFHWDVLKAGGYAAVSATQPPDEMLAASGEASFTANRAAEPQDETYFAAELLTRLSEMLSPTAYSQDIKLVKGGNSPLSGETVTTTPTFTLPANKSVVIKYRATVDNGPYAAGINNIDNFATISGSNFANVNSTTASIALDAAPNLSVNATDGSTETQPGVVGLYNLTYANATGINLQGTNQTRLSVQVPVNTSFNLASSGTGWSCADGATNPTVCTNDVGALVSGGGGSKLIAFNINLALPATALTIAPTATIAENPANDNGTDLDPTNNASTDTDNVRGIWIGGTSTDWAGNTNWSNNLLPNPSQNISVPSGGGANSPSITSVDVTVGRLVDSGKNVTIGPGRTLLANLSVDLGANNILGAGTLELASGAPITRTTGQVNCALKKNFINGNFTDDAQIAPEAIFTFPVGTATGFSPVTANVTAGSTGSLTVQAIDGTAPSTPALSDATTLDRYWQLAETGDLTASLTFNYLQADVDGVETNYRLIRSVAGSPPVRFPNGCPGSPCVDGTSPTGGTIFANPVTSFSNFWTAGEPLAPTAAGVSISGRVLTADGRGIRNARIVVTGNTLVEPLYAQTSTFGYYTIEGLRAGETYVVTVNSKRFLFSTPSRVITALDNVTELDFIASPE